MAFPGAGLAKGLAVTFRTMTRRSVTQQYPDVRPDLPPRSRGVIALLEENCTVCMLCARECPDWCIYIDSHKETVPPKEEGARARQRNVLDRFAIDYSLCMYCGICVEVCPFDALFWSPEFEYSEYDIAELVHEKDRLREWMGTVPPPPALDDRGEEPKEVSGAQKALSKPARPARPAGERPERPARAERAERPARPERPDRPARPGGERPERPARPERVARQSPSPSPRATEQQATEPGTTEPGAGPAAEVPPAPEETAIPGAGQPVQPPADTTPQARQA
ncbi:MAG: 4Fe-4S binding protein, partial [Mycobacterium leprae]